MIKTRYFRHSHNACYIRLKHDEQMTVQRKMIYRYDTLTISRASLAICNEKQMGLKVEVLELDGFREIDENLFNRLTSCMIEEGLDKVSLLQ